MSIPFAGRGILFTDLDGTLLDFESYRPSPAAVAAVERLAADRILTIPVTSKTGAEVAELAEVVRQGPIAVVEGGAVLLLEDGSSRIIGAHRDRLIRALATLRADGWSIRGFSDMTEEEVADLTGLDLVSARRAMQRLASEPFVMDPSIPPDLNEFEGCAADLGIGVTRGGRFWHLLGTGVDKGTGVEAVVAALGAGARTTTGAVGDAWNDLPMLERVDVPYFLGSRVPVSELPVGVRRVPEDGPEGFVKAALSFLDECR